MSNFNINYTRDYYLVFTYQGVIIEEKTTREKKILFVIEENDTTFIEFSETGFKRYAFTEETEDFWHEVVKRQYSNYDIIRGIQSFAEVEEFNIKFFDEE